MTAQEARNLMKDLDGTISRIDGGIKAMAENNEYYAAFNVPIHLRPQIEKDLKLVYGQR